ncbi:MAG: hypothetical protein HOD43_10310 [Candidatus Marinimicrobia bacterium]|jgi:hypothetical protein|nr:hypothetical protein [Candidatus Neomarinimicrobiota bacterium]MBT3631283.1 hypothetical protein [Candidatus Neomarinimicrobiota bacterium]MBT3824791.1 hypothetical protein [Candidatus Neomarinimicrobiota bacterium]MBT4132069.1 hypothetical protein [Candidatus Neomarinimicrobiota bacterium]MBT4296184.1 hypothetical protein [Candidatus Neomarinimicrobiota bacterium]
MELYHSNKIYTSFSRLVATLNVSLQVVLIYFIWDVHLSLAGQMAAFILAFILTDFLNGLVHMIMDHKESYDSFYGPLVANFHLHHQTPKYTKRPLPVVYFNETGAKIWLVPFLIVILSLLMNKSVPPFFLHTMVYIGILSSVAEVSHYLCHTSDSKTAHFLARIGILLSRVHHAPHHEADNMNYAFLNGMSDPLINLIARTFFKGYKTTTDQHFVNYASGAGADQR